MKDGPRKFNLTLLFFEKISIKVNLGNCLQSLKKDNFKFMP